VLIAPVGDIGPWPCDAVVYGAEAERWDPRAFARFEREVRGRGIGIARIGEDNVEAVDEVIRELRLSRVLELTPPSAQRFSLAHREWVVDGAPDVRSVSLPPPGAPPITLRRTQHGVRLDCGYAPDPRSVEVSWCGTGVAVSATNVDVHDLEIDWLCVRRTKPDAFSAFADTVAGRRGHPRLLLEPLVRCARVWLLRALPAQARALARTFDRAARAIVAARTALDTTGRVAQLARTCPGVFSYAMAARAFEQLDDACGRAIAGARLRQVLDVLLDSSPVAAPAGWRARHARFLRRALPSVEPRSLVAPFAAGLALDDVPREPAANRAWFRAAAVLSHLVTLEERADAAHLAAFVSARGAELGSMEWGDLHSFLRRLAMRRTHLGRSPSRHTSVESALGLVRPWTASVTDHHPPDLDAPTDPRLTVRRLRSADELAAEGVSMRHCVANLVPEVERDALIVLSILFGQERLTATVMAMPGRRFFVDQLRGVGNALPTEEAWCAVGDWLEGAGAVWRSRKRKAGSP